jgi:hypothetical protein
MRHLFARPETQQYPRKQSAPTPAEIAWWVIQVLAALASIGSFCAVLLF